MATPASGKNRKKILIVGWMPPAGLEVLKKRDDVDYEILGLKDVAAHYHAKLKDAHAVTLGGTPYRQGELDVSPEMMVVARLGVGFDAVDVAALSRRKVPLMTAASLVPMRLTVMVLAVPSAAWIVNTSLTLTPAASSSCAEEAV